ncbi:hypothetical protein [Metapseudomonas resinovorans]|uniref:Uncharacterized protein n=1 Tax=Metapseudomonas resinovorans NBRC 106553 TaxID=1245471 RepID=S6AQG3_METRE|nr:hypothetical protein [Pseudomonas resinovorans]BAN46026.1 hypothetical protein PCA10_02940 [Pseudomonas resinovorans NBRC 106553]
MCITDRELEEIGARCNSATPGPWVSFIEGRDYSGGSNFIMTGSKGNRGEDIELTGATSSDQDFIAHARQDVPKLIDEIKRLKTILGATE